MPTLRAMAPQLLAVGAEDIGDRRPVLLYKAWTSIFRDYPPYVPQQIGDCVSFSHAHANDLLQCVEWVMEHGTSRPRPVDIQEPDTEFIYGASRQVAGMLGGPDGSYNGAAVRAMTTVGLVTRRMVGEAGPYSDRRAKAFGRSGVPDSWKAAAAKYRLGDAARVTTWDELTAAIRAGHPVTISTGQGFTLRRDAQGFVVPSGRWGHSMFIAALLWDREGACVIQSWGPSIPTGPRALDQPPYSFWIERPVVESILAEGDSFALSRAPKFGATAAGPSHRRRRLPASWRG